MSSPARRRERRAEWEAECTAREEAERRVANLSLYERIEECDDLGDIKRLLHDFLTPLSQHFDADKV